MKYQVQTCRYGQGPNTKWIVYGEWSIIPKYVHKDIREMRYDLEVRIVTKGDKEWIKEAA